jgi:hypothetical protein
MKDYFKSGSFNLIQQRLPLRSTWQRYFLRLELRTIHEKKFFLINLASVVNKSLPNSDGGSVLYVRVSLGASHQQFSFLKKVTRYKQSFDTKCLYEYLLNQAREM